MERLWEADPDAGFARRLGRSPQELGLTSSTESCPDLWELSNGDVAVIGRVAAPELLERLPASASVGADEQLVIIPRRLMVAAKPDIPDA